MTQIKYDFGSGRSDPATFPVAALQAAANKVIEEQAEALTQYPGDLGHAECALPWPSGKKTVKASASIQTICY